MKSCWSDYAIRSVTHRGISLNCQLLQRLGFEMRVGGSHHFFRKAGTAEAINLQPRDGKAKNYQVRQARKVLQNNQLL